MKICLHERLWSNSTYLLICDIWLIITWIIFQLLEIKANGFYGKVYKGKSGDKFVAVKVFPLQQKQSWVLEQEIYKLPRMSHENILKFIGVCETPGHEFWLMTEFHEKGNIMIHDKTESSMIHSANPQSGRQWRIVFVLLDFEKCGRTDGQTCVNIRSNHYRPWLWVGRVDQYKFIPITYFSLDLCKIIKLSCVDRV